MRLEVAIVDQDDVYLDYTMFLRLLDVARRVSEHQKTAPPRKLMRELLKTVIEAENS